MAVGAAPTAISALSISGLSPRIFTPSKSSSVTIGVLLEVKIDWRVM